MNAKKFTLSAGVLLILVALAGLLMRQAEDYSAITDYDTCVAAGFLVMESYPEQCRTPDGRSFTRVIAEDVSNLIKVTAPLPGGLLLSPGMVRGEARGTWYFEASFPVKLIDANGVVLVETYAQAQGEWMTEEFVPFQSELKFAKPTTETGTLILKNDNPSGDPIRDKEIRIPVKFNLSASKSGAFNQPITLSANTSVEFPGKFIVLLEGINDSRCKPDVQCIWQGELQAQLVVIGQNFTEKAALGTVNRKSTSVGNGEYSVELRSATETTATIVVTKR